MTKFNAKEYSKKYREENPSDFAGIERRKEKRVKRKEPEQDDKLKTAKVKRGTRFARNLFLPPLSNGFPTSISIESVLEI